MKILTNFFDFVDFIYSTISPLIIGLIFVNITYYIIFPMLDNTSKHYAAWTTFIVLSVCVFRVISRIFGIAFPKLRYGVD